MITMGKPSDLASGRLGSTLQRSQIINNNYRY